MIIFYQKLDGKIVGFFEGRIHDERHLKMWIGDEEEIDRLVIQWKPTIYYNEQGEEVPKGHPEVYTSDFEPDHPQVDLIMSLESDLSKVYTYKVSHGRLVK